MAPFQHPLHKERIARLASVTPSSTAIYLHPAIRMTHRCGASVTLLHTLSKSVSCLSSRWMEMVLAGDRGHVGTTLPGSSNGSLGKFFTLSIQKSLAPYNLVSSSTSLWSSYVAHHDRISATAW